MDWIEQWLGWAPDGGDGSIEALIVIALIGAVMVLASRTRSRVSAQRRRADDTRVPLQSS